MLQANINQQQIRIGNCPLRIQFDKLFSIYKSPDASVASCFIDSEWKIDFLRNFGEQEFIQWNLLKNCIMEVDLNGAEDRVSWCLEKPGVFSVKSLYKHAVFSLLDQLQQEFAIKDLGDVHYFLCVVVEKKPDGIILTMRKYINDLLDRAHMRKCKPVNIPMSSTKKLSKNEGNALTAQEATTYRSIVGALQYLTLTRHDIAYPVSKVCQILSAPTIQHWSIVKRILRFLK